MFGDPDVVVIHGVCACVIHRVVVGVTVGGGCVGVVGLVVYGGGGDVGVVLCAVLLLVLLIWVDLVNVGDILGVVVVVVDADVAVAVFVVVGVVVVTM